MTRYFESFFLTEPMVELSEKVALERGTYVAEDDQTLRRYRRVVDGKLDHFIYAPWRSVAEPLADLQGRGVSAIIHSPTEELTTGRSISRTWYVDSTGTVTMLLEDELDAENRVVRESSLTTDGKLLGYSVYHYNDYGELYEVVSHDPDGRVLNVHEAPL